jgi:hypothetical protein
MSDSLNVCSRCTSDACYESKNEDVINWYCFGCGFHSNNFRHKDQINYEEVEDILPNLYKDLRFIDDNGYVWYPTVINDPEKGMVFAEGISVSYWKWSAVLMGEDAKPDMKTLHRFDEKDYMEALDYIGYFNQE